MKVTIAAHITPTRGGFQARAQAIGLAGFGETEVAALTALRRSAEAWCIGLSAAQGLEEALKRRHIRWTKDSADMTVVLVRSDEENNPRVIRQAAHGE
jgi:hypothetical protein